VSGATCTSVRDTVRARGTRRNREGVPGYTTGECDIVAALAPPYSPRRPTETVLYGLVRRHLESFVAHAREHYDGGLPAYVEAELRAYLGCGLFSKGFTRCHCDACGHDLLVAFSCKRRGICPSCAGRRMASTAAHLVDRVLPDVPVRQFVLSLPYELRRLAAFKAEVLGAFARIFVEVVFASYRARVRGDRIDGAQCGAVTFVQRFGGSLNLNIHFHTAFLDGVFTRDETGRVRFHCAAAPDPGELQAIVRRVHGRVVAWLRRRGHLAPRPPERRSSDLPGAGAIEACAEIAMQRGAFAKLVADAAPATVAGEGEPPTLRLAAEHEGFNLHAGVRIVAGDDVGRERLMRYGARPALALDRLRRLPDGRVAYRVKYARAGAAKHRVMSPLEFLARLSAIIPPPRYPLVRFHGVLGPRSGWRAEVVPRPREAAPRCERAWEAKNGEPDGRSGTPRPAGASPPQADRRSLDGPDRGGRDTDARDSTAARAGASPPGARDVIQLTPNVLAVHQWRRLHDGALLAAAPYVDWATLMRRTFDVDVLACAKCGGRLRVLAVITEAEPVRRILEHLGLPSEAPPLARARDPTDEFEGQSAGDAM